VNKKIVVLNGSPRQNGNTAALISAFTKGAVETGNSVTAFHLDSMEINGCKGCFGGGINPDSPCVQKDDMDTIYTAYREADIVVLASPLYYYHFSGQFLKAFNRLFAVAECDENLCNPVKNCVLLMAADEEYPFDEVLYYYNGLMKRLGWKPLGQVLVGGVTDIGDMEGHPALEDAQKLGVSLG